MNEPLADLWHTRDLVVLRAAVKVIDEKEVAEANELVQATGFDEDTVRRAILALHRGGYVEGAVTPTFGGTLVDGINEVAREAYQLTGAWPSAESVADRLIAALTDVAEHGDDEVTRSKARKALEGLGGLSRDLLVAVVGAAAGATLQ